MDLLQQTGHRGCRIEAPVRLGELLALRAGEPLRLAAGGMAGHRDDVFDLFRDGADVGDHADYTPARRYGAQRLDRRVEDCCARWSRSPRGKRGTRRPSPPPSVKCIHSGMVPCTCASRSESSRS